MQVYCSTMMTMETTVCIMQTQKLQTNLDEAEYCRDLQLPTCSAHALIKTI